VPSMTAQLAVNVFSLRHICPCAYGLCFFIKKTGDLWSPVFGCGLVALSASLIT
jgi:hypothetical protein